MRLTDSAAQALDFAVAVRRIRSWRYADAPDRGWRDGSRGGPGVRLVLSNGEPMALSREREVWLVTRAMASAAHAGDDPAAAAEAEAALRQAFREGRFAVDTGRKTGGTT